MRKAFAGIAVLLVLGIGGCGRSEPSSGLAGGNARSLGLPAGGPPVLYAPPPDIPQLQNRDERFRAPFELVSGTERYVDGEYLYSDFIYDDDDATYPDDFERYAGNAADLVEFRMAMPRDGGLAVRFTLNTMLVPDSTIAVVAFDSDNDANTGSSTLPRDPDMPFPGTDQVLTTWGTGAAWSWWNGSSWDTVPLAVNADLEANQITVTVPQSVAHPSGQWKATLATGLYDAATGGWLALGDGAAPRIVNLGFRFAEAPGGGNGSTRVTPSAQQQVALAEREPTRFANPIDFDLLRHRGQRDNVPMHGTIYRLFASRLTRVPVVVDGTPGAAHFSEGKWDREAAGAQLLSPLQPYLVYVPRSYDASRPTPLTINMHPASENYYWIGHTDGERLWGEERGNIIVSPGGRSSLGWYKNESEYDVFEAWNDAARHYRLDPSRVYLVGYSMGAHGTYRLGLLYPQLFARAATISGPPAEGIWVPGLAPILGEDNTLTNRWLENARNLPYFNIADTLSETVPITSQVQQNTGPAVQGLQSFESLGYRYTFWALAAEHFFIGTNFPVIRDFLGDHPVEPEPFHVTYARMPSSDNVMLGLVHNRAYWLSGIELRDGTAELAKGLIDAVSLGFGRSDPTSTQSIAPGLTAAGVPYVETQRTWSEARTAPVENRILIKATNIASVTINTVAARVDCNVKLDIESDGPMDVTLLGCR